uniref:Uncharacterized protein n=1 Tax=Oryza brachyantha TaxID=4533 RepID=J3M2R4_ORYBR
MDSFSIQITSNAPGAVIAGDQMVDAAGRVNDGDEKKLQRALVGGGIAKATAALLLAFFRSPPPGGMLHSALLFYAYYGILLAVVVVGAAEVGAGYWVSRDPANRRGVGKLMVWPSVVSLVIVAGLGGFAVFK